MRYESTMSGSEMGLNKDADSVPRQCWKAGIAASAVKLSGRSVPQERTDLSSDV